MLISKILYGQVVFQLLLEAIKQDLLLFNLDWVVRISVFILSGVLPSRVRMLVVSTVVIRPLYPANFFDRFKFIFSCWPLNHEIRPACICSCCARLFPSECIGEIIGSFLHETCGSDCADSIRILPKVVKCVYLQRLFSNVSSTVVKAEILRTSAKSFFPSP